MCFRTFCATFIYSTLFCWFWIPHIIGINFIRNPQFEPNLSTRKWPPKLPNMAWGDVYLTLTPGQTIWQTPLWQTTPLDGPPGDGWWIGPHPSPWGRPPWHEPWDRTHPPWDRPHTPGMGSDIIPHPPPPMDWMTDACENIMREPKIPS